MGKLSDILGAPFKIGLRITVGIVGFLLMGLGLLLIEPLGILIGGIPVFIVGLLLLVKAVF